MNAKDKQDLELVHYRLDELDKKIDGLSTSMDKAHIQTRDDLKFLKESLFNPNEGLWAETKLNSQFREDSKKWRYPIGVGLISLVIKNLWDFKSISLLEFRNHFKAKSRLYGVFSKNLFVKRN